MGGPVLDINIKSDNTGDINHGEVVHGSIKSYDRTATDSEHNLKVVTSFTRTDDGNYSMQRHSYSLTDKDKDGNPLEIKDSHTINGIMIKPEAMLATFQNDINMKGNFTLNDKSTENTQQLTNLLMQNVHQNHARENMNGVGNPDGYGMIQHKPLDKSVGGLSPSTGGGITDPSQDKGNYIA